MIADSLTKGLTTQCVQRTLSQHVFKGETMILDIKGPRQESALKQKGIVVIMSNST
jgi:hypothetical protein